MRADTRNVKKYVSTSSHGGMIAVTSNNYAGTFVRYEDYAELLAIAEAAERAPFEYEFEVWQDDAMQAGGTTTTLESAIDEAAHYRMMYGQDGPVEVKVYERRAIPDAAIDRLLAIGEDG